MIGDRKKSRKEKKAPVEMQNPDKNGQNGEEKDEEKTMMDDRDQDPPPDEVRIVGPQVRVVLSGHRASERSFGRERLCKHKYSSFCVDDVLDATKNHDTSRRNTEIATLMAGTDTTDTLLQAATASDGNFSH